MKRQLLAALGACTLVVAGAAPAATLSDNFIVTAQVNASCAMDANDIAFGNWDPLSGDALASSPIYVTCSAGLPYSVTIDMGSYYSVYDCAAPARQLYSGSSFISYTLYRDAGLSQPWGCDASSDWEGIGNGAQSQLTVYARIPAAQTVLDGYYQDNLVATITF